MLILRSTLFALAYFIFSLFTPVALLLFPPSWVRKIFSRLDAREEERRIEAFRPFVRAGDTALDVGAGSGRFARVLQERLNLKVSGVDVCDYADPDVPIFTYDGRTFPFPDNSFDVVCFGYVLHHIRHQETILREACRVARKAIIIFEDVTANPLERLFTCWNDFHNNVLHGWIRFRKGYVRGNMAKMPLPFTFRSIRGWKDLFAGLPVTLVSQEIRRPGWKPLTKVVFCLKVQTG